MAPIPDWVTMPTCVRKRRKMEEEEEEEEEAPKGPDEVLG